MPIKCVLFDGLQTLIDLDPSFPGAFARVSAEFGYSITEEDVARVMPVIEAFDRKRLSDEKNLEVTNEHLEALWLKMNEFIFTSVGITGDAVKLAREIEDRFARGELTKVYPDVIPLLKELRSRDLRLGIISNGTAGIMGCFKAHGLDMLVDFILISGIVGWEKPSRRIFEMALEQAGVLPEEALFIGDHYEADIEGARRMGIRSVLINRHRRAHTYTCEEVDSLSSILALL